MGYRDFIESPPDSRNSHKEMPGHREFSDQFVLEYGFPAKEMIGDDYAMSAVKLIIFQAPKTYREKYKDQFINEFGKHLYDVKNENGQ